MSATSRSRAILAASALSGAALASLLASPANAAPCPASAGDCAVLVDNGTMAAKVDIAFMGDGYTAAEHDKFVNDAAAAAQSLFSFGPYAVYKPMFNALALFTPSQQSGADDPSENIYVNTAFNATFDAYGIPHLLVVSNNKVLTEVTSRCPQCQLVVVLVNSTEYGGSGGSIAVISLAPNAVDIVRHELGHTLGGLADEYPDPYPGFPTGDSEPNVAAVDHLEPVKWAPWITPGTPVPTDINLQTEIHSPIGAYEGARYQSIGMFRPAPGCIMRTLGLTFCPVCEEAMVLKIAQLSKTIEAPTPPSPASVPLYTTQVFSSTLPPLLDLSVSWSLDGVPQPETDPTFSLSPTQAGLGLGPHALALTVKDETAYVRNDPQQLMKETFTWSVNVAPADCAQQGVPDGAPCTDGDGCTQVDVCQAGACVGASPVVCAALDLCHLVGTCNPATGACDNPAVDCPPIDQCHVAGKCDPATGACDTPAAVDGTACDDGDACTQVDACQAGACAGMSPVACAASDQCHVAGACDPATGACDNPAAADGAACDDGDACTQVDTCKAGVCGGASPVTCAPKDECHVAGTCDASSGQCSDSAAPDGSACTNGACSAGVCVPNEPAPVQDDGGCGCAVPGEGELPSNVRLLALLGAASLFGARRRVRARARSVDV